jgi:hypothetical protein
MTGHRDVKYAQPRRSSTALAPQFSRTTAAVTCDISVTTAKEMCRCVPCSITVLCTNKSLSGMCIKLGATAVHITSFAVVVKALGYKP